MSASPLYREHLRLMTEFLVPDGAVGITFYTKNIHQEVIANLIENREQETLVPFSLQPKRTARMHLKSSRAMEFLAEDDALIGFLAGDMDGYLDMRAKHGKRQRKQYFNRKGLTGKALTRTEVVNALSTAGLHVSGEPPSLCCHVRIYTREAWLSYTYTHIHFNTLYPPLITDYHTSIAIDHH